MREGNGALKDEWAVPNRWERLKTGAVDLRENHILGTPNFSPYQFRPRKLRITDY
jgi:hypothetical protein